jgi:hypothetical protein
LSAVLEALPPVLPGRQQTAETSMYSFGEGIVFDDIGLAEPESELHDRLATIVDKSMAARARRTLVLAREAAAPRLQAERERLRAVAASAADIAVERYPELAGQAQQLQKVMVAEMGKSQDKYDAMWEQGLQAAVIEAVAKVERENPWVSETYAKSAKVAEQTQHVLTVGAAQLAGALGPEVARARAALTHAQTELSTAALNFGNMSQEERKVVVSDAAKQARAHGEAALAEVEAHVRKAQQEVYALCPQLEGQLADNIVAYTENLAPEARDIVGVAQQQLLSAWSTLDEAKSALSKLTTDQGDGSLLKKLWSDPHAALVELQAGGDETKKLLEAGLETFAAVSNVSLIVTKHVDAITRGAQQLVLKETEAALKETLAALSTHVGGGLLGKFTDKAMGGLGLSGLIPALNPATAFAGIIAPLHLNAIELCNRLYIYFRMPCFLLLAVALVSSWDTVDECGADSMTVRVEYATYVNGTGVNGTVIEATENRNGFLWIEMSHSQLLRLWAVVCCSIDFVTTVMRLLIKRWVHNKWEQDEKLRQLFLEQTMKAEAAQSTATDTGTAQEQASKSTGTPLKKMRSVRFSPNQFRQRRQTVFTEQDSGAREIEIEVSESSDEEDSMASPGSSPADSNTTRHHRHMMHKRIHFTVSKQDEALLLCDKIISGYYWNICRCLECIQLVWIFYGSIVYAYNWCYTCVGMRFLIYSCAAVIIFTWLLFGWHIINLILWFMSWSVRCRCCENKIRGAAKDYDTEFGSGLNVMTWLVDHTIFRPIHKQTVASHALGQNRNYYAQAKQLELDKANKLRELEQLDESIITVRNNRNTHDEQVAHKLKIPWFKGGKAQKLANPTEP